MSDKSDSALHMMEGQGGAASGEVKVLSDEQIVAIASRACAEGKLSWVGFKKDAEGRYTVPLLNSSDLQLVRAVVQSVAPKTSFDHWVDEVETSGEAEKHAAEIIGDEDAAIRAWWTKEGLALPAGTKLYATSADAVASLKEELAKAYELFARERGITKELAAALQELEDSTDWTWDNRARVKARAALSKVQQP